MRSGSSLLKNQPTPFFGLPARMRAHLLFATDASHVCSEQRMTSLILLLLVFVLEELVGFFYVHTLRSALTPVWDELACTDVVMDQLRGLTSSLSILLHLHDTLRLSRYLHSISLWSLHSLSAESSFESNSHDPLATLLVRGDEFHRLDSKRLKSKPKSEVARAYSRVAVMVKPTMKMITTTTTQAVVAKNSNTSPFRTW